MDVFKWIGYQPLLLDLAPYDQAHLWCGCKCAYTDISGPKRLPLGKELHPGRLD